MKVYTAGPRSAFTGGIPSRGVDDQPELVEYYIEEYWFANAVTGTLLGSLHSDGSKYAIYENHRPIKGKNGAQKMFRQFISVREKPRLRGSVTVANHFRAWAKLGMKLETLGYQMLAVEAAHNAGEAYFRVRG